MSISIIYPFISTLLEKKEKLLVGIKKDQFVWLKKTILIISGITLALHCSGLLVGEEEVVELSQLLKFSVRAASHSWLNSWLLH